MKLGAFDFRRARAVWQMAGHVIFDGPVRLSNGFKLSVAPTGTVSFGAGNIGIPESQVICRERITFGAGSGVGWNVLITDTDFHPLVPLDGEAGPSELPVEIGEGCWIGARSTIVKGVRLPHDTVVAAGSVVARSVEEPNTVIGGNPAKHIRSGVAGWRD